MVAHMLAAIGGGLGSNAIFSGGVLLLIATYFMNYLRQAVTFLVEYIMRRFFIEIELKPNDDAFRWLITYVRIHETFFLLSDRFLLSGRFLMRHRKPNFLHFLTIFQRRYQKINTFFLHRKHIVFLSSESNAHGNDTSQTWMTSILRML
jgi:hypothetical protein